jgi:hypothetical protein
LRAADEEDWSRPESELALMHIATPLAENQHLVVAFWSCINPLVRTGTARVLVSRYGPYE